MIEFQRPFGAIEFADNAEPRCPCLLLLDKSGSMEGAPISELNEGLVGFRQHLTEDRLAAKRVEIAIVGFGPVEVVSDFVTVDRFEAPRLVASGDTPMGEAIELGLDMLNARKKMYPEGGVPYFRPLVFLMSDGSPTDKTKRAARLISESEHGKKLSFFPVGVEGADMGQLQELSVRAPVKLRGLAFAEFFRWLSNSLGAMSRSSPGDVVPMENPTAPGGWATFG